MATPFVGQIMMVGFNFAPRGWVFCSGQLLPISQFDVLFALIGTTYGGDGQNTFAAPDLRGRIPIHQGQGAGLSNYVIGQLSGVENVTLATSQTPLHTHTLNATAAAATAINPSNLLLANTSGPNLYLEDTPTAPLNAASIGSSGGGSQPHENMQPYICVNFCIAVEGIFPSRN